MKFRAIVQARIKSERLPGKILKTIRGETLLDHISRRWRTGAGTELVFAIPDNEPDLADHLRENGMPVTVGPEKDVLQRYLMASADLAAEDYIVRLTGDNPFVDAATWPRMAEFLRADKPDLAYTAHLPLGCGYEVFRAGVLRAQPAGELQPNHREHVSWYIKEHPEKFSVRALEYFEQPASDLIRMTIDEPADLEMLIRVADHFAVAGRPDFDSADILELFRRNPDFFRINASVKQRTGNSHE